MELYKSLNLSLLFFILILFDGFNKRCWSIVLLWLNDESIISLIFSFKETSKLFLPFSEFLIIIALFGLNLSF